MSIASAISSAQTKIANAYTAVNSKGGTLPATQNLSNLPTAINSIPSGSSATLITKSITTNGTYNASSDNADGYSSVTVNVSGGGDVTLTRVSDDNGNEIGTWYCNFTDANGNTYKVILLDAQYRNSSAAWCSNTSTAVTNMPLYSNLKSSNVWEAGETATQNSQLILDFCTAQSVTSTACSHCRSKSFVIGGVTYYGQLPNLLEVSYIAKHYNQFDVLDTSASSQSSLNFSSARQIWSSSQYSSSSGWYINTNGYAFTNTKTLYCYACPVLEIPLT